MTGLMELLRGQTEKHEEVSEVRVDDYKYQSSETEEVAAFFYCLNGGKLDLTAQLPGSGAVATAVNGHLAFLEGFFSSLMENLVHVSSSGIVLENQVRDLSLNTDTQADSVREITRATEGLNSEIRVLAERVSNFTDLTHASFTAASEGFAVNEKFQQRLENLRSGMLNTIGAINKLTGLFDAVLSLTGIINKSAGALHLISINTAVEAARAGDRGFGVIAKELRGLAQRAGESAREVDRIVFSVHDEMQAVDSAIADASSVMDVLISDSEQVGAAFGGINDFARKVEEEGSAIAEGILKQQAELGTVTAQVQEISQASEEIRRETGNTGTVAARLKTIVERILEETGSLRLNRHVRAVELLRACLKGIMQLPVTTREQLDGYLQEWIRRHDHVELVYAIDSRGRQVSANIVSSKYKGSVREQGYGEDRSQKEYFTALHKDDAVYVSDIYLSAASGRLCITVSGFTITPEGTRLCIALDLNLEDLVRV